MSIVVYDGVAYEAAAGETVLEALLRQGVAISNSCRAGACQSCMLRASSGRVPREAQAGLKTTLAEQGYFLSCVCRSDEDLVLEPAGGLDLEATITALEPLTPTVLRARIRVHEAIVYRSGQYITLRRSDGLARSYSLASLPHEDTLELHIRRAPQGRMSNWLFDEARENEAVTIRGPAGDCFYTEGNLEQPLLLAGTGTGLAPLVGICRDAVQKGHRGPIHLYHGALRPEGLYLQDELAELIRVNPNVSYTPAVLESAGPLDKVIAANHPNLKGWRGYTCGDPGIVRLLKKKFFLAGMASREIFADAFAEAPVNR